MKASNLVIMAASISLALTGCGSKSSAPVTPTDSKGEAGNTLTKKVSVGWGVETLSEVDELPPRQRVTVSLTDETGAAESHELGEFEGGCAPDPSARTGDVLTGLRCWYAGAGTLLTVRRQVAEIVVLRAAIEEADADLEPAFEELTRIPVPVGAEVVGAD